MIVGFHLLWTAYGCWLPNDPRGSLSKEVVIPDIAELGPHHYERKKQQPTSTEIREFYNRANEVLKFELLKFNALEVTAIARGFANAITTRKYTCYACAIMPDHVHILIRKHRDSAEMMIDELQNFSRDAVHKLYQPEVSSLRNSNQDLSYRKNEPSNTPHRRNPDHPVWGGRGYRVFLNNIADVNRTIKYINENPIKIGQPQQSWPFVTAYNNWLPGQHPDRK